MAMAARLLVTIILVVGGGSVNAQLSTNFYTNTCPLLQSTVQAEVVAAAVSDIRVLPQLLRLHYSDCFVNGCDASVLLDDTESFTGEKTATQNRNLGGFEVIDRIKTALESSCPGVVSCADVLTLAARYSVVLMGGPSWTVQLGRRDSSSASLSDANAQLPAPGLDLNALISAFANKGFTSREMVALSGGHSVGVARCATFRDRIYNEANIDPAFAAPVRSTCPTSGGDDNSFPLDAATPLVLDNLYFRNLVNSRGLLHSDQQLFSGGSTDAIVTAYANNAATFNNDFVAAMLKMSTLGVITGANGQIRTDCRRPN